MGCTKDHQCHRICPPASPPVLMSQHIGPGCSEAFLSSPTSLARQSNRNTVSTGEESAQGWLNKQINK